MAYIDASGTTSANDKENYVLSATIINECAWQQIDNEIKRIKIQYFPNVSDENVEFHAKDMMNRDDVFKNLPWFNIYYILSNIFDFISDPNTNITIISVVVEKNRLKYNTDIEFWAYKLLFERLDNFMNVVNNNNREIQHPNEFCIMITDTEGIKRDLQIRKKLNSTLKNGTGYSALNNIIEELFFTDSKFRNLSQITDCIAYCIRREYRSNPNNNFHVHYWKSFFQKMTLKFYSNPLNGEYIGYGLKIFPN